MNASFLIQLVSDMELTGPENLLLRFGIIALLLLPLGMVAIVAAFLHAPEGYEDETGFHFTESRSPRRNPAAGAVLHPQSAN